MQVRDASGAKLSQNYYSNGVFTAIYAGLWMPAGGARVFAVGTQFTGNAANPTQLIVSRWLPGGGTPWTNPVNAQTVAFTPAQLGLVGKEVWGCRIVDIGTTDLFVSGCTRVRDLPRADHPQHPVARPLVGHRRRAERRQLQPERVPATQHARRLRRL